MSLEAKIEELIAAVNANTAALTTGKVPANIDAMKANIGEMEREMGDDTATEKPAKGSKKKTSKKKTSKKTAAVESEATQQGETSEVQTEGTTIPAPLNATKVQAHLRGIASQLTDTSKLFALIQKHGAQQFSNLDPSVYNALIADAEQLVVDGA